MKALSLNQPLRKSSLLFPCLLAGITNLVALAAGISHGVYEYLLLGDDFAVDYGVYFVLSYFWMNSFGLLPPSASAVRLIMGVTVSRLGRHIHCLIDILQSYPARDSILL